MANTQPMKLINIAKRYQHITPVPRMPNFAAWIEGVDLTRRLSKPVQAELRQALFDFEVIFFKPQTISPTQHLALAKVFGPLLSCKMQINEALGVAGGLVKPCNLQYWFKDEDKMRRCPPCVTKALKTPLSTMRCMVPTDKPSTLAAWLVLK